MISNAVATRYPNSFGNYAIASNVAVSLSATGNAVAVLPVTAGTNYIIRRITVANASGNIGTGNVTILTSNDGNASNAVSNNVVLSSVTSTTTFQDIGLATAAATAVYSAAALFVKVNTAVTGTCNITVYGDVINL